MTLIIVNTVDVLVELREKSPIVQVPSAPVVQTEPPFWLVKDPYTVAPSTRTPAESKTVAVTFGWETNADMDAIALHTSWHIRSGTGLATKLNLSGAEKEASLTKALQDFLKNAQIAPDGTSRPFATLQELFQAHENFYKSYSPRLWPRLEGWFKSALERITAAGPPP